MTSLQASLFLVTLGFLVLIHTAEKKIRVIVGGILMVFGVYAFVSTLMSAK